MGSEELQAWADGLAPTAEQPERRPRVERLAASERPLGQLGLVGLAGDEELVVVCGD